MHFITVVFHNMICFFFIYVGKSLSKSVFFISVTVKHLKFYIFLKPNQATIFIFTTHFIKDKNNKNVIAVSIKDE